MTSKPTIQRKRAKTHDVYGALQYPDPKRKNQIAIKEMTDGELFAIGLVTVHWAYLEHAVLLETAKLVNRAKFKELPADAVSLSFARRLAAFRTTVSQVVKTKKNRDRLLRLASRISTLEDRRHKITHGLWQWYPSNPDRLQAYSYRPRVEFVERNLSFKKIIDLSRRIAEASYELAFPPTKSRDRDSRAWARAMKDYNFAYVSRKWLLEIRGREHATLGPRPSMPPLPTGSSSRIRRRRR
jgi:hypothetical protein